MEPAITALHSSPHNTDTMSEPQYLKMEDVHHSTSASPAPSAATDSAAWSTSSPAPIVVQSKPTKKRKSWGQALPEPKTALPPRKRAKTEDEKEQRRIERIKRNRAAAHNSRERKRQETEDLAVKLAKANAELAAFKAHFGELPSHIVLPEVKVEVDDSGVITASAATPAPSLTESHGSQKDPASPTPPADDHAFHHIKMEPQDIPVQLNVPQYEDSKLSALTPLDLTQHSAAMLCNDLQCRSSRMTSSTASAVSWTHLFSLMNFNLQNCYKTLLIALWTTSPSRMERMMQASAARSSRSMSSSTSTKIRTWRSTPRRLARSSTATGHSAPLQRESSTDIEKSQTSTRDQSAMKRARAHQKGQAALKDRIPSNEGLAIGNEGYESNGVADG
ncbi:unnamed protein product [Cercospora beticola]|nr:unnamed protein product [Cercospora beticola]